MLVREKRVLAVDLDLGGANLHTYFGLASPERNIADFITGRITKFSTLLVPVSICPGLMLAAGGRDEQLNLSTNSLRPYLAQLMTEIFHCKARYGVDFVILDLGAGSHELTLDFFLAAHVGILTLLPEPTAIENAYGFLRKLMIRQIAHCGIRSNTVERTQSFMDLLLAEDADLGDEQTDLVGYRRRLAIAAQEDPGLGKLITSIVQNRRIGLALNQSRNYLDAQIGLSMAAIIRKYFGFNAVSMGYLNYDECAWKALRNKRPLVQDFGDSVLAHRLASVSREVWRFASS